MATNHPIKTCRKCKSVKLLTDFPKDRTHADGLASRCKQCRNQMHHAWYRLPGKRAIVYRSNRLYRRSSKGKATQAIVDMRYRATEKGRANWRRATRKQRLISPQKHAARSAVRHAVKVGRLPSAGTLPCRQCGNRAAEYHHHLGYEKPHRLKVVAICKRCHNSLHRQRPTPGAPSKFG